MIYKYSIFKRDETSVYFSGVKIFFIQEFTGQLSEITIGGEVSPTGEAYTEFQVNCRGKGQIAMKSCNNNGYTYGMQILYGNGDVLNHPHIGSCNQEYKVPANYVDKGVFRGLSFKRELCNGGSDFCIVQNSWRVVAETDKCSRTTINDTTVQKMTILVGGSSQNQDISALSKNWVAVQASNPAYCGMNYIYSLSPLKPFLNLVSKNLVGYTNDPSDVGLHNFQLAIELQPYERFTKSFTVEVVCILKEPECTTKTLTIEVGISNQPSTVSFTQTQTCGVSATLETNPAVQSPWLTLVSSNTSGGIIQVNNATLAQVGTYTVTIRNSYLTSTTSVTLTVIIKDPCSRAIFQTTPAPLTTMTVDTPSSTIVEQAIKIFTDVEVYNGIICPITATKIQGFTPVSVALDPATIRIDPSLINLPSEIGKHAITIQVTSSNYSELVTAVDFTFDVVVICTVSSLSIATQVTDFGYILNSGSIAKGTFNPVQQNDCKYAVAWTNTQYSDNTLVGSASNFNLSTQNFDFLFTDPALIGTVQKYVLRATISQNYPNSEQQMYAEHTINVTIQCEVLQIQTIKSPDLESKYRIKVDSPLQLSFLFVETPSYGLIYNVQPALPFITLLGQTNIIQIETTDLKLSGVYDFTLTAAPATPCLGVTKTEQFQLKLLNLCETTTFYNQAISDIHLFKQDPDFKPKAQQVIKFQEFQYEALRSYQLECGPVKTIISVAGSNEKPPDWVQLSKDSINLEFSRLDKATSLKLELVAFLEQYPTRKIASSFQVSLSSSQLSCLPSTTKEFKLGQPPLHFGINFKNETQIFYSFQLTPIINAVGLDEFGSQISLPGFVKFNENTSQFQINQITQKEFGQYSVGLSLGYREYAGFSVICPTKLTLGAYQPSFQGEPIEQPPLICGRPWSVQIPQCSDGFGQPTQTTVNLGEAKEFLTYLPDERKITTGDFDTSQFQPGSFTIEVTHTDMAMNSKQEQVDFQITCNKKITGITVSLPLKENSKYEPSKLPQRNPPRPFISQINQFGQMRVIFSQPILLPTFSRYPEFTQQNFMRQNCTNTTKEFDLCINQNLNYRMLKSNILDQNTTEAIDIVNRGLVLVNGTFQLVLDLKMIPGIDSDQANLNMTWKCEDFKPTHMDFLINFQHYRNISINDFQDSIELNIYGNQYFRSAENKEQIEQSVSVIMKPVPQQINPEIEKSLQVATQVVGNASKAVMIGQFVMNLFLGGVIQQLFSVIRKMTIMVHLLLINVKIPPNTQVFFEVFLQLVTFNIINFEPYIRKGLNLYETEDIDENFIELGYTSNYFIINMGNLFIVLVYLMALLIFYVCTQNVKHQGFLRLRNFLTNGLIWNTILSFLTESYALLVLSSLKNLQIFKFTSLGTGLSLILAMLALVVVIGFPIWVLFFLLKNSEKLNWTQYRNKYGTLYEQLNFKKEGQKTLLEPFFTLIRILTLMLAFQFLKEFRYFQLFSSNFCMTFMIIYVGMSNCYVSKTQRFFEQFNELFVAITNYHLMCFADFIQDEPTREVMGWSMIACVGFNLIVNIGFIMASGITDTFYKLRKLYAKNKYKRIRRRMAVKHAQSMAEIADQNNRDLLQQNVEQAFPTRPKPLQIESKVRSENKNHLDSSQSQLIIETNNQKEKKHTKPFLLPGQIEQKSQKPLQSTLKVKAQPRTPNEEFEEEKILQPRPKKPLILQEEEYVREVEKIMRRSFKASHVTIHHTQAFTAPPAKQIVVYPQQLYKVSAGEDQDKNEKNYNGLALNQRQRPFNHPRGNNQNQRGFE